MKFDTTRFTKVPGSEFGGGTARAAAARSLRAGRTDPMKPAATSRAEFHTLVKPIGADISALRKLINDTDPRQLHAIGGTIADLIDAGYDFARGVQVERRMYVSPHPYKDDDELVAIEFGLDDAETPNPIRIRFTNV